MSKQISHSLYILKVEDQYEIISNVKNYRTLALEYFEKIAKFEHANCSLFRYSLQLKKITRIYLGYVPYKNMELCLQIDSELPKLQELIASYVNALYVKPPVNKLSKSEQAYLDFENVLTDDQKKLLQYFFSACKEDSNSMVKEKKAKK